MFNTLKIKAINHSLQQTMTQAQGRYTTESGYKGQRKTLALKMGQEWIHSAAAESLQSCPTLCDPIDSSPPGSPVPGILQARTLEWVATSFSNAWKWKVKGKSLSRVRLSDPMDCSLPGSSVHGIFQARVLEWGAITFSGIHSGGWKYNFSTQ